MPIVSCALAALLGFAAQRASICNVRAVAEVIGSRTGYMLASIGKSVLWVVVVTVPFFRLMPAAAAALGGWRVSVRTLAGGVLMGLGAALAPGGDDALILDGIPSLSPHALPTYAAMVLGIAVALIALRRFFGIEMRVKCSGDVCLEPAATASR